MREREKGKERESTKRGKMGERNGERVYYREKEKVEVKNGKERKKNGKGKGKRKKEKEK
jgi:hypothetical protein